jgi:RHS repeat-associated protein
VYGLGYIDEVVLRDRLNDGGGNIGIEGSDLDERMYYQQDREFNVTALVSQAGAVTERYAYDPYGDESVFDPSYSYMSGGTAVQNQVGFTGRWLDETGMWYFRDRYYDPSLGRFISRNFCTQSKVSCDACYKDGFLLYGAYFIPGEEDPSGDSHVTAAIVGSIQVTWEVCKGMLSLDGWIWAGVGVEWGGNWWGASTYLEGHLLGPVHVGSPFEGKCGKCSTCCDPSKLNVAIAGFKENLGTKFGPLTVGTIITPNGRCGATVEVIGLLDAIQALGPVGAGISKAAAFLGAAAQAGIQVNGSLTACLNSSNNLVISDATISGGGYIEAGWAPNHSPGKPPKH